MSFAATQPSSSLLPPSDPGFVGEPVRVRDPEQDVLHRTLVHTLCVMSGGSLALLLAIVVMAPEHAREVWIIAALGLAAVVLQGLLRRQWLGARTAAGLVVAALMASGALAVVSFGSVRSSGSDLFLASVVAAGVFLGQRQMRWVVLLDAALLGALMWAEMNGLLTPPTYGTQVGVRTWMSHTAILGGTGVMLMYAMRMRRELTDRVRHELQRRRAADTQRDLSLARFGRIFQASPMALVAQSMRTGTILDVNPACVQLLGYRREELLGRTDAFLWVDPSQRLLRIEQLQLWRRVERGPGTLRHADGHGVPLLLTSELENHPHDQLLVTMIERAVPA